MHRKGSQTMSVQRRLPSIVYFHLLLCFVLCEEYAPRNVRILIPDGDTDNREYQCVADGNPPPTYLWRKEGLDLPDGVTPDGDRLRFPRLTSDFNGQYTCEVTNSHGTAKGFILRHIVDTSASKDHDEF
ncbi:nectin-4-like [Alosa alosa]|uniref:nectin-4-like n=1 Tax=Alosa alosa TaxID=278164 RepID=UPI00201516A0|nr:nectin-4-like [Alosa alosa]